MWSEVLVERFNYVYDILKGQHSKCEKLDILISLRVASGSLAVQLNFVCFAVSHREIYVMESVPGARGRLGSKLECTL